MVKYLISRADVSFDSMDIEKLKANCDEWKKSKDTLGAAYSKYLSSIYSAPLDSLSENKFHYSYRVESSSESRKDEIDKIVALRNELVHLFPMKYLLDEEKVNSEAIDYLDECFVSIKSEFNRIRKELELMMAMAEELGAFLSKSNNSINKKLIIIRQLTEIQREIFDKDGWTNVSDAGRLIREFNGNDSEITNEYKSIGLKNYILNTNSFKLKNDDNNWKYKVNT